MEQVYDDSYVVYALRHRRGEPVRQVEEREVVCCPTYEEAQQVRRAFAAAGCDCVIRFVGETGGGD